MTEQQIPAGWYQDPMNSTMYRWWNGTAWSTEVRSMHPQQSPPQSASTQAAYHAHQSDDYLQPAAGNPYGTTNAFATNEHDARFGTSQYSQPYGTDGGYRQGYMSAGVDPFAGQAAVNSMLKEQLKIAKSARRGAIIGLIINPLFLFSIVSWIYARSVINQTKSFPASDAARIAVAAERLAIAGLVISILATFYYWTQMN